MKTESWAESRKLPCPRPRNRTLLLVHLKFKLAHDESREALHHSFPCSPAANVDITIVRIPRKPEPAPFQLPVELVEHDVRQQGRQRPALRRPFVHRIYQPALHHSGLQKNPDQLQ